MIAAGMLSKLGIGLAVPHGKSIITFSDAMYSQKPQVAIIFLPNQSLYRVPTLNGPDQNLSYLMSPKCSRLPTNIPPVPSTIQKSLD